MVGIKPNEHGRSTSNVVKDLHDSLGFTRALVRVLLMLTLVDFDNDNPLAHVNHNIGLASGRFAHDIFFKISSVTSSFWEDTFELSVEPQRKFVRKPGIQKILHSTLFGLVVPQSRNLRKCLDKTSVTPQTATVNTSSARVTTYGAHLIVVLYINMFCWITTLSAKTCGVHWRLWFVK
jgi:hypothetical protein